MTTPISAPRTPTTNAPVCMRKTVNLADFGANGLVANCLLLGSIPVDSYIKHVSCELIAAFNAGTTNVLTLGVTSASANELLAAGDITEATVGYYVPATPLLVLGRRQTQTAQAAISGVDYCQSGVGLWAKYTQSGTAATTGQAIFVIEYIAAGDSV